MQYARVVVTIAPGDSYYYGKFTRVLLDTYPTGHWCVDWGSTKLDERRITFVVDDADYARQVIFGYANDTGQNVESFTVTPVDRDEFVRLINS
jgi:glucose dehydrogenase